MTKLHLKITRTRTDEKITLRMQDALQVINAYNDKQKFMNALGQEDFWKKNRLLLWKELGTLDIKDTDDYKFGEEDATITTDFITTDRMLGQIAYRLGDYYNARFAKREDSVMKETNAIRDMNDYYFDDEHGRTKSLRTRRVSPSIISVQHADVENFRQELEALYNKYQVEEIEKVDNGKRYFDTYEVSRRLVSLYYVRQNGRTDY